MWDSSTAPHPYCLVDFDGSEVLVSVVEKSFAVPYQESESVSTREDAMDFAKSIVHGLGFRETPVSDYRNTNNGFSARVNLFRYYGD